MSLVPAICTGQVFEFLVRMFYRAASPGQPGLRRLEGIKGPAPVFFHLSRTCNQHNEELCLCLRRQVWQPGMWRCAHYPQMGHGTGGRDAILSRLGPETRAACQIRTDSDRCERCMHISVSQGFA